MPVVPGGGQSYPGVTDVFTQQPPPEDLIQSTPTPWLATSVASTTRRGGK